MAVQVLQPGVLEPPGAAHGHAGGWGHVVAGDLEFWETARMYTVCWGGGVAWSRYTIVTISSTVLAAVSRAFEGAHRRVGPGVLRGVVVTVAVLVPHSSVSVLPGHLMHSWPTHTLGQAPPGGVGGGEVQVVRGEVGQVREKASPAFAGNSLVRYREQSRQ